MTQSEIREELSRLRQTYAAKDQDSQYRNQYAPLTPLPLGYHLEQVRALGTLLHDAGLDSLADLSILDVGCGSGRLVGDLLTLGALPARICGVDLAPQRVAAARAVYPNVNFRQVDGDELFWDENSFDLVLQSVVFSSIHSSSLRERLASEISRVVKPGGYIFWWDLPYLVDTNKRMSLNPSHLFPRWPIHHKAVSWCPRPSQGIARRRWRVPLGWLIDRLAARPSHVAALIGPKPQLHR